MPGIAPSNLVFTVTAPTTGILTWQNNNDDPPYDQYQYIEIWENRESAGYGASPKYVIAGHKESKVISGLDPDGINYCYKVLGGWWEPPGETADSNEDCEDTYYLLQAPSGILTTVFSNFIEIIFKDKSSAEDVFCIYRNVNGGDWPAQGSPTYTVAANVEYYRDTAVTPGDTYQYRVAARENPSNYSAYGTGTQVTANNIPNDPTGATISEVTDEEMRVTWVAPAAGFAVTGYKVQISDTGVFGGEETEHIVDADVLTLFFKGLTASQQYWIRVYSYNGVGDSASYSADNDTCLAVRVRTKFETFVRDPNIEPVYIAGMDLKMDMEGFPLMSDDDLVGCWPFDETSGMVATDKSKQGNHGSLENMEEADHVDGKVGKALDFDGENDFVEVMPDGYGTFNNQSFTISAWIKFNDLTGDKVIFSYDYTSHIEPYYSCHLRFSNVTLYLNWNDGSVYQLLAYVKSDAVVDTWYHVVGVYTSGNQKLYVDGIEVASSSRTDTITFYNQEVWIGRFNYAVTDACKIDEVRIYKRALTADEAKALHDTPGHRIHEIPITERGMTIDHAWEDGEAYIAKASKALVQATASTFYHDTANRKLYIHTSAEDNPYNFFIEAGFTHLIPNRNFAYADTLCTLPPWLSAQSIPQVTQENKPYFSGSFRLSTGSISLINALSKGAYYFDKRFEKFTWIGSRLTLYCGKDSFSALTDFKKMFSAYISDKSIDDKKITFSLRDSRKELERDLVLNKYWITDYPDMEEDFDGREKPKAYGYVEDVAPVPIKSYDATTHESAKFSYHDGRSKTVGKVMVNEIEKAKDTDYYCDLQRSIIVFDKSVEVGEDDIILVSFTGQVNSADEVVENGAEIFKHILNNEANIDTTKLNVDWIYEARDANTKSLSILFYKDTPYDEILRTLEHTTEAYILQDGDARLGLRPLQTTVPSKAKYIWNFQSKGHKHSKDRDSLYYRVKVFYGENPQNQEWEVKEATDENIKRKFGVEKELPIYTYFRDPSNAQALATKILSDYLNKTYITDELPMILFDQFPGELIPFSRDRFYDTSGTASEVTMRILRIEKNPQSGMTGIKMERV